MQRLTGLDAGFLSMETPNAPMHVAGLAIFDPSEVEGRFDVDHLREVYVPRLHLAPPFRRRLREVPFGLHHPLWIEDPDFDIDWHLRHVAVPAPGGPRELADLAAHLNAIPLDRSRPLWEMWLIDGVVGGHVAVLSKVHHAAIDGASGNEITVATLDIAQEGSEIPPPGRGVDARCRPVRRLDADPRHALAAGLAGRHGQGHPAQHRHRPRAAEPAPLQLAARAVRRPQDIDQRAAHPTAGVRHDVLVTARGQGHQGPPRRQGQRRGPGPLRRRPAPLVRGPRRGPVRAARRHGAGVGADRGGEGGHGQPGVLDAGEPGHRGQRPGPAPAGDRRRHPRGQRASRRRRRRADRLGRVRGAGAAGPGRPPLLPHAAGQPAPARVQRDHLQRPRPAVPAVLGRGPAGGQLSDGADLRRGGPEHDGHELPGAARLRPAGRSRAARRPVGPGGVPRGRLGRAGRHRAGAGGRAAGGARPSAPRPTTRRRPP